MASEALTTEDKVEAKGATASRHRPRPDKSVTTDVRPATAEEIYPKLAEGARLAEGGLVVNNYISNPSTAGMKRAPLPTPPQPHGTLTLTPPEGSDAGSLDVLEQMLDRGRRMVNAGSNVEGITVRVNRFGSLVKSITLSW